MKPEPAPSIPHEGCRAAWKALPADRREPVLAVARRLASQGVRSWLVGGAVRDLVLGTPVGDLDMVSAARPEEVQRFFPRSRAIGKSFGIIQVEGLEPAPEPGFAEPIELATFRLERGYQDGRRPDHVEFTDRPELDALRRDFTCNALYFDPLAEEVLDPTDGLTDMAQGILRTVGEPQDRFAEDGLRLLRVARFLARFDWRPGAGLLAAARQARSSLRGVSAERILGEFQRMAQGARPEQAWSALHAADVLRPCFQSPDADDEHGWDLRAQLAPRWLAVSAPDPLVLWLALGADPSFSEMLGEEVRDREALRRLEGLKVSHQHSDQVRRLIRWLWMWPELAESRAPQEEAPEEVVRILREPFGSTSLDLARLFFREHALYSERWSQTQRWFEGLPTAQVQPDFLPSGRFWLDQGFQPGPELGALLLALESAALRGAIRNETEAQDYGRKLIEELGWSR